MMFNLELEPWRKLLDMSALIFSAHGYILDAWENRLVPSARRR